MEPQEYVSPSLDDEPVDDKSAFDRFAEVFFTPATAFEGVASARNRTGIIVWGYVVAVIVSLFAVVLFTSNDELREKTMQTQFDELEEALDEGKISQKSYDQSKEGMEMMNSKAAFIASGVVIGILTPFLLSLFAALIIFIIFRLLQRKAEHGAGYSVALAAVLIALMIYHLQYIITTVGMFLTSDPEFRTSLGYFAGVDNAFASFALGLIDPFLIWLWIALGTGVAVITQASREKAIAYVAGSYIIVGLIGTAIGAALESVF